MKARPGQTLLEVLIAITIIVIGIVSLITLLVSAQNTARLSYEETVALELGREAIEAARFVRDSNWLEREAGLNVDYSAGLRTDTNDYTAIYTWQPDEADPATALVFDFTVDTSTEAAAQIYFESTQHYYIQANETPSAAWTTTPYKRFVTLYPICSSDAGITELLIVADGEDCTTVYPGSTEIGIQVAVTMEWTSSGAVQTRTLEERLYNWKYAE